MKLSIILRLCINLYILYFYVCKLIMTLMLSVYNAMFIIII